MQTVWKQAICIFYCYKSCSCAGWLLYNKIVSIGSNKKMTKTIGEKIMSKWTDSDVF